MEAFVVFNILNNRVLNSSSEHPPYITSPSTKTTMSLGSIGLVCNQSRMIFTLVLKSPHFFPAPRLRTYVDTPLPAGPFKRCSTPVLVSTVTTCTLVPFHSRSLESVEF